MVDCSHGIGCAGCSQPPTTCRQHPRDKCRSHNRLAIAGRRTCVRGWLQRSRPITTARLSQPIEGTSHAQGSSRGRGKSRRSLALIDATRAILSEIQPASVRAVCYRLFVLGLISSMAKSETSRVSKQITWAREHGLIPWGSIVDETREAERVSAWENPAAYVRTVKGAYLSCGVRS